MLKLRQVANYIMLKIIGKFFFHLTLVPSRNIFNPIVSDPLYLPYMENNSNLKKEGII